MKKFLVCLAVAAFSLVSTGCTTTLLKASAGGDTEAIRSMLNSGTKVNERGNWKGNPWKLTPLMLASAYGRIDTVRMLLEKGADVNAKNTHGETALHYAVCEGQHIDSRFTSSFKAASSGYDDIVKLLLDNGADISLRTSNGKTALNYAEEFHSEQSAKLLLAKTANLDTARKRELAQQSEVKQNTPSDPYFNIKSDVDDLPSRKAKANKNAYAIIIGIEQYRQKLPKADFATHDAQSMTEYLTKVMGYPEENVVTLLNDRATKSDFEKYFGKWLSNNVEKGGSVFVYYSGHGAPNTKTGDAYLVPYDGDPAFIDETGYSLKRLYEQLGRLEAKEIVVALDSCFSGAGGRSVIAKGARPLVMNMNNSVIPPKVAVLSASSGEQISSTYDEKGHGLFTYFMLKGLKGEAETNGSVEIGNLFEYIKPQVERIARKQYNNEQTPQLIAPKELMEIRLR